MGILMDQNGSDTVELLQRARAGEAQALNEIFTRHRGRLRRMVELRLDHRIQGRIDASDVIQDAYVEVAQRLEEYLKDPKLPLFLWLRLVVGERLIRLHRHHLGTQMRDAGREVSLYRGALPAASSAALAAQLRAFLANPQPFIKRAQTLQAHVAKRFIVDAMTREVVDFYADDTMGHPVGTGPFVLKEWVRRSKIVLEKNPNHRGYELDVRYADPKDEWDKRAIEAHPLSKFKLSSAAQCCSSSAANVGRHLEVRNLCRASGKAI